MVIAKGKTRKRHRQREKHIQSLKNDLMQHGLKEDFNVEGSHKHLQKKKSHCFSDSHSEHLRKASDYQTNS